MKHLPFVPAGAPSAHRPAIIVPLTSAQPHALAGTRAAAARAAGADALEWRVDALGAAALQLSPGGQPTAELSRAVETVLTAVELPLLITVRTAAEGGAAELADDAYARLVAHLIDCVSAREHTAVDIETARADSGSLIARAHEAGVPVVGSHHVFDHTPSAQDMLTVLRLMCAAGVDVAKLAVMPHTPADVARLLSVCAELDAAVDIPVIAIAMGSLGEATRVCGADFGSAAAFATVDGDASAPGQLTVEQLHTVWRALNR